MGALKDLEPVELQRDRALGKANDVRVCVANFKRELAGLGTAAALKRVAYAIKNRHGDTLLGAAKVRDLITASSRYGRIKAKNIMAEADIRDPDKRLRDLTDRQRREVVAILETEATRWRA
jgi:poly-gamma-glutamate capsule biosynthesis protein CapA/YwtB (metallophosphatase superfamily)